MIQEQGLELMDATCPFVKKIHNIVSAKSEGGYEIIIIGNADHPEVEGIRGWVSGPVTVIETEEEARHFAKKTEKPLCIVSQTTFNYKKFDKLVEIISDLSYDRPREIARKADAMIVVGGKHSSNTQKLFEICKKECANTYYIQTLVDLDIRLLPSRGCVGITAGASTPNNLIEEVSKQCRN